MSEKTLAAMHTWLIEPLEPAVAEAIARLRRAPDVQHIAVLPDVHLASDVCIGIAIGTSHLLYPQAVGGDIGCGILALAFDAIGEQLADPSVAGSVLAGIGRAVPNLRRNRSAVLKMPQELIDSPLSHASLASVLRDDGVLQFGTLGSGNHFIELQADDENRLWLMIHSGSRAMGQAIREHHMAKAEPSGSGLKSLDARDERGLTYLADLNWARRYADANRRAMAQQVAHVLGEVLAIEPRWETAITTDHNHLISETHHGRPLWVHRKGAMAAGAGVAGVLPGSMGTTSFHVVGRGCTESLCSSAHGAGRALSRIASRRAISRHDLYRQMRGVWYDPRMANSLREEAPSAYEDIRAVLRAQHELVTITRTLRPLLNYK
jgi:tRNA-splicing ligase RtcB